MITNFNEFEEWRRISLNYHKGNEYRYLNALNYFELARIYFQQNGFPDATTRNPPTKTNPLGTVRKWNAKESKEQLEEIRYWITTKKTPPKKKRRKKKK